MTFDQLRKSLLHPGLKQIPKDNELMLDFLGKYLQTSLDFQPLGINDPLREFLEISDIDHQGHQKFKECFMQKKAGGRMNESRCVRCGVFWGIWKTRYLCITSDGVSISNGRKGKDSAVKQMIMIGYNFSVQYGLHETGSPRGIILNSSNRKLRLEASNMFQFFDFLVSLKDAMEASPYLGLHRFASFSPIREDNNCKWFVDGEGYFRDVFKYVSRATREIFITDWWLSPQFHLVRPILSNTLAEMPSRLDILLRNKAEEDNVKIFIIVYKEPTIALSINSHFTKSWLQGQHPNIKVLRHPSTVIPFMWSHHEKLVIVDQKIAFLGGLDICYGRMDNAQHLLYDPQDSRGITEYWPGIDFCNGRTKDFSKVTDFHRSDIDRTKDPRLPWHDIALRVVGEAVIDASRHFIEYWNFVHNDLKKAQDTKMVLRMRQETSDNSEEGKMGKSGFIGKIKRQWRKFKQSRAVEESQIDEPLLKDDSEEIEADAEEEQDKVSQFEVNRRAGNYQNIDCEEHKHHDEAVVQQESVLANSKNGSNTFHVRNQNDIYFKQLAKVQHNCHQIPQQPSESIDSAISPLEQPILFEKLDSQQNQPNSQTQSINNGTPKTVLQSAFPILQTRPSSDFFSPGLQVEKRRSHSFHMNQHQHHSNRESESTLNEPFLKILSEVRKGKDLDTFKGFFQVSSNNNSQQEKSQQSQQQQQFQQSNNNNNPSQQFHNNQNDEHTISIPSNSKGSNNLKNERSMSTSSMGSNSNKRSSSIQLFPTFGLKDKTEDESEIVLKTRRAVIANEGKATCQMLRSSCLWSCGVKEKEFSIHIAYIHLIGQAEHFIYIENQFFISSLAGEPVQNGIAQALVSRIRQAHSQEKAFKIIVVLPLLPGFQGEIDGDAGLLKIQLHWQYNTISRGGNSIFESLRREGIDANKYIQFYGLRTHAQKLPNQPVSEIVYVHSKLMIIDDRIALIGSANINDRSMLGQRDSEIAMVVEDKEIMASVMDGKPYKSARFAHTLRTTLFQEHFGLAYETVIDPISEDFIDLIQRNSIRNSEIYREVFRCYPDDLIKKSEEWHEFNSQKDLSKYDELKEKIIGFAVQFPLDFLSQENLRLKITQKEYFVQDINFT